MKTFTYHNPVEIHFGGNTLTYLSTLVKNRKALLVTTPIFDTIGVTTQVKNLAPSIVQVTDKIDNLPTLELLKEVYNEARAGQPFEWYRYPVHQIISQGTRNCETWRSQRCHE